MLRLLLACNWILLLMILFLANHTTGNDVGALEDVGLVKAASRLATVAILTYLIAETWSDPRGSSIFSQILPWCCFTAWAIISTLWSPLRGFTLGQAFSLVMLLMLSYCTGIFGRRLADASKILQHLCLALLVLSIGVLAAYFFSPETLSLNRGGGGLFHPTNASATASLGIIVVVYAWMNFTWSWSHWLLWPSLVIHGAILLLASNRASLVITSLIAGTIVLLRVSAAWRWLILTGVSFACALYITLDPGFLAIDQATGGILEYANRGQTGQQIAGLSGRDEMWATIWESFLGSPWVGHGYAVSSDTGKIKVWYRWANWTAHNFWLQALVSTGIVGATLLAWGMVSYAGQLLHSRTAGIGLGRIANLGVAVLVWQVCWGITNESFVGPLQPESIVFFTVVGLVSARCSYVAAPTSTYKSFQPGPHSRLVANVPASVPV